MGIVVGCCCGEGDEVVALWFCVEVVAWMQLWVERLVVSALGQVGGWRGWGGSKLLSNEVTFFYHLRF